MREPTPTFLKNQRTQKNPRSSKQRAFRYAGLLVVAATLVSCYEIGALIKGAPTAGSLKKFDYKEGHFLPIKNPPLFAGYKWKTETIQCFNPGTAFADKWPALVWSALLRSGDIAQYVKDKAETKTETISQWRSAIFLARAAALDEALTPETAFIAQASIINGFFNERIALDDSAWKNRPMQSLDEILTSGKARRDEIALAKIASFRALGYPESELGLLAVARRPTGYNGNAYEESVVAVARDLVLNCQTPYLRDDIKNAYERMVMRSACTSKDSFFSKEKDASPYERLSRGGYDFWPLAYVGADGLAGALDSLRVYPIPLFHNILQPQEQAHPRPALDNNGFIMVRAFHQNSETTTQRAAAMTKEFPWPHGIWPRCVAQWQSLPS